MAKTLTDLQTERESIDIGCRGFYEKLAANRSEFRTVVIEKIIFMCNLRSEKKYQTADSIRDDLIQNEVALSVEKNGVMYFLPGDPYPYFMEFHNG